MESDLIVDVGMHRGADTEFYLRKGFRVVGIEAIPWVAAEVAERLAPDIEDGRLRVLNVAVSDHEGVADFYVNLQEETWSTIISYTKTTAEFCLGIAMAAVGLGTSIRGLIHIGLKPLGVGLFSALLVGVVSITLISALY